MAWILAIGPWLTGCSLGYLLHLGKGQVKIVCQSQCIEDVLRDPEVPESVKVKIRLVLEAKDFGQSELGLASSKNYTRYYAVEKPPVAYNLTASPKLALEAYRWCFPIAGCLPYKGFFDRERAVRQAEGMSAKGYDTYVRPVSAYSTLGWFRDPIFSTMLDYGETGLVEVILHEMVHRTIFVKDQGDFNEGVATFVGEKGTEAFFRKRRSQEPEYIEALREKKETRWLFQETMFQMAARLRLLYSGDLQEAEKLSGREVIFEQVRASLQEELARRGSKRYQRILNADWNNALLVSYLTYHRDPQLWEALYNRFDQDLAGMVRWLKKLDGEKEPMGAIRRWLEQRDSEEDH